jgi:YVTN family beta-propeller protein
VAYDAAKGEVFVTNHESSNISVISDRNDTVVATLPVATSPEGAAYDAAKGEVFVASDGTDNVSVINDTNDSVVATVPVNALPWGVAYDAAEGEVFVADVASTYVSVISDATNKVVATVGVGPQPEAVAYDPATREVFVTIDAFQGWVGVISDATNKVVATVPIGIYPSGVAYDTAKREIFVAYGGDYGGNVSVISDATDTVVATVPVGLNPNGVAYDAAKGEVFVTSDGPSNVSVINDTTDRVVATVPVGIGPDFAAYDAAKGEVFVANGGSNNVSVIWDGTYAVTFTTSPPTCGSITFNGTEYANGQLGHVLAGSYAVSATACADYALQTLSGNGSVSVASGRATVSGEGGVTATFLQTIFPVTFTTSPMTCGSIEFNGTNYTNGGSVQASAGSYGVLARACAGYALQTLAGTGSVTVSSGTATVSGAGGITATFVSSSAPKYTVTFTTGPSICGSITFNGTVYTNGESVQAPSGSYAVSATACTGYALQSLAGTGSVALSAGMAKVTGAGGITAAFARSPSTPAPGFLGYYGDEGYYVLGGVVAAVVAAIAAAVLVRRTRSKPAGAPSPPRPGDEPPTSGPT